MIYYRCARCRTIIQADEELRGKEHACPHCTTINLVPGGEDRPSLHHVDREARHEVEEEIREPLTVAKVLLTCLYAVLAFGAAGVIYYFIRGREKPDPAIAAAAPFLPYLDRYVDIKALREAPPHRRRGPYVLRKALLVNLMDDETATAFRATQGAAFPRATRSADGSWRGVNWNEYRRLPDEIRATKPDEVGTVVWLKWTIRTTVRPGKHKVTCRRIVCDVTVIDLAEAIIVGGKEIQGPLPDGLEGGCGPRPTRDVARFLTELPRLIRNSDGKLVPRPAATQP